MATSLLVQDFAYHAIIEQTIEGETQIRELTDIAWTGYMLYILCKKIGGCAFHYWQFMERQNEILARDQVDDKTKEND